jgi:hypothetical protein
VKRTTEFSSELKHAGESLLQFRKLLNDHQSARIAASGAHFAAA